MNDRRAYAAVAAGLFEGEGTITISWSGWRKPSDSERRNYTRPIVTLASTDREIVTFFNIHWAGNVCWRPPSKNITRARQSWTWTLNAKAAIVSFLDDIEPYVVTTRMKRRIDLLRFDISCRIGRGKVGSREYRIAASERLATMRELNRRGTVSPSGMTVGDILVPRLKDGRDLLLSDGNP